MTELTIPALAADGFLPERKHSDDAGADLRYCGENPVFIAPGERKNLPTSVHLEIPDGYAGLVCPRSGLAVKFGLTVLNSPGIIDAGYRGEVRVPLVNHGDITLTVNPGDRIAQLLILPALPVRFTPVDVLGETDRGTGGFGSTGVD
jgi:dUTP pyrophosphatase